MSCELKKQQMSKRSSVNMKVHVRRKRTKIMWDLVHVTASGAQQHSIPGRDRPQSLEKEVKAPLPNARQHV